MTRFHDSGVTVVTTEAGNVGIQRGSTARLAYLLDYGREAVMGPLLSSFAIVAGVITTAAPPPADKPFAKSGVAPVERPVTAPAATPRGTVPTPDGALVGTWRLVSYVDTPEGGEKIYAFGRQPIGQFIFTADGHVSISIMRNPPDPRTATTDVDPDACVPAWYCSYFGTYSIAADQREWTTHVRGGNIPAYVGTDQRRAFRIDGDRLIVSETYQAEGKTVRAERVLERAR